MTMDRKPSSAASCRPFPPSFTPIPATTSSPPGTFTTWRSTPTGGPLLGPPRAPRIPGSLVRRGPGGGRGGGGGRGREGERPAPPGRGATGRRRPPNRGRCRRRGAAGAPAGAPPGSVPAPTPAARAPVAGGPRGGGELRKGGRRQVDGGHEPGSGPGPRGAPGGAPGCRHLRSEHPRMFGETRRPQVRGEKGKEMIEPLEAHGVRLMSLGFLLEEEQPAIMRGPLIAGILKQFLEQVNWGPLDVMVVDMPPGTGDAQLSLVQTIDVHGAVMVSTPQAVSTGDVRRGVKMFERVNTPVLGVVENMAGEVFGEGGAETLAREMEPPLPRTGPPGRGRPPRRGRGSPRCSTSPDSPGRDRPSRRWRPGSSRDSGRGGRRGRGRMTGGLFHPRPTRELLRTSPLHVIVRDYPETLEGIRDWGVLPTRWGRTAEDVDPAGGCWMTWRPRRPGARARRRRIRCVGRWEASVRSRLRATPGRRRRARRACFPGR
jgi:Mrp family chromosome partitioning ATPase